MPSLYSGSSINTTVAAQMFNQLWGTAAVQIVRKDNGLLYAITGKTWRDTTPTSALKRMRKVSGNRIEVKILGRLETPEGTTDGADEFSTVTPAWSADTYGAMQFDLTHLTKTFGVPSSEWTRIKGDEAKTKGFIGDKMVEISLAYENLYGNSINSNANDGFSRGKLGNWQHALSDGVTAGEAGYATYGTIDRSDPNNGDFRGTVMANVGDLTLAKIKQAKNLIRAKGGKVRLMVAETGIYTKLETLVEGYAHVTYDEKWSKFGGSYFAYSGMVGVQEARASANVLGLIDPEAWAWWCEEDGLTEEALIRDPRLKAGRVIPTESWCGFFTNQPSRGGKLTGIN